MGVSPCYGNGHWAMQLLSGPRSVAPVAPPACFSNWTRLVRRVWMIRDGAVTSTSLDNTDPSWAFRDLPQNTYSLPSNLVVISIDKPIAITLLIEFATDCTGCGCIIPHSGHEFGEGPERRDKLKKKGCPNRGHRAAFGMTKGHPRSAPN